MTTEVFKSWADVAIMVVIAVAYVWTALAQSKVIKSKNETINDLTTRNQEMARVSRASLDVASERVKDTEIFKQMYNPEMLKQYIEINIKNEVDKVKNVAEQQAVNDKEAIQVMNDSLNEGISYIAYMLYVEKKYTKEQRIKFFHTFFDKSKDLYWYITNKKIERIELVEKQKNLNESENSGG